MLWANIHLGFIHFLYPKYHINLGDYLLDMKNIDKHRSLSKHEIYHIMKHVFAGLKHCHAYGIVHRNLKPKHLMIDMNPQDTNLCTYIFNNILILFLICGFLFLLL